MALKSVKSETVEFKYDRTIWIAEGKNRNAKEWKNKNVLWRDFVLFLRNTRRTGETQAEYFKMSRSEQDGIKDVGGFVGGDLAAGRRKKESVRKRDLITLDFDHIQESTESFYNRVILIDAAHVVYSTHKHKPDAPRLRVIFCLNRSVTPDEYQAIARKIAEMIDIEAIDDTSYEVNRLMYWGSTSSDAEYYYQYSDLPFIDADEILESYPDWKDMSYWPRSSREAAREFKETKNKNQEDPREKQGIIGAFCNVYYPISAAIDKFLPDVYEEGSIPDRYTFIAGTSANGLIVDDLFGFSWHSTDPANTGHSLNAFDLVRIHKFGKDDPDNIEDGKQPPSFQKMMEFAANDPETSLYMDKKRYEDAGEEFSDEDPEWRSGLKRNKKGEYLATPQNLMLIFKNDPKLANFKLDLFADKIRVTGDVPYRKFEFERDWDDRDMANLRIYLEVYYGIKGREVIQDSFENCLTLRAFHPVKNYLESAKWDGKPRIDTLFIDLFGAPDNEYTRMASRLMLVAAVARVYKPGIKFDYVLVLIGEQGIRKSSLFQALGRDAWFTSLGGGLGKEAYEMLQGRWIIEIEELSSFKKNEIEAIKAFVTNRFDRFRPAYGRFATDHPRQCVFFGTTNTVECLHDATGNRRFLPILAAKKADLSRLDVNQIWAEAVHFYKNGQQLFMEPRIEAMAKEVQKEHTEESPMAGLVRDFLEKPIPANWDEYDWSERWAYYHGDELDAEPTETRQRTEVCAMEIWEMVYAGKRKDLELWRSKEINAIVRNTPGWNDMKKLKKFKIYGPQRGFTRE